MTDLRRVDLDDVVLFEEGTLTLYPDREKPKVGEALNKEAVVTLIVRPSRSDRKLHNQDALRQRLAKISEEFGGRFISYNDSNWIFRVPHFNGPDTSTDRDDAEDFNAVAG